MLSVHALQEFDQQPVSRMKLVLPSLERALPAAHPGQLVVEELIPTSSGTSVRASPVLQLSGSSLLYLPKVCLYLPRGLSQRAPHTAPVIEELSCKRHRLAESSKEWVLPGRLLAKGMCEIHIASDVNLLAPSRWQWHLVSGITHAAQSTRLGRANAIGKYGDFETLWAADTHGNAAKIGACSTSSGASHLALPTDCWTNEPKVMCTPDTEGLQEQRPICLEERRTGYQVDDLLLHHKLSTHLRGPSTAQGGLRGTADRRIEWRHSRPRSDVPRRAPAEHPRSAATWQDLF